MNIKSFITNFIFIFIISFIVSILVAFLYGLIVHGKIVLDFSLAFRNGLIFGIILPLANSITKEKK